LTRRLTERLRTETRALHAAAERTSLMGTLMRGALDRATYCALLRNLHALYAALEPALQRHAQHAAVAPVSPSRLPGLTRQPALEHDLLALHGPHWADEVPVCPAAADYVERLHLLDATRPELLAAHAYVRYLGDLSGGQMLKRVVAGMTAPGEAGAVAFYEFGDAAQTSALTLAFRDGLAALPADVAFEDALVEEVGHAYGAHRRLFEELMAGDDGEPTEGAEPQALASAALPVTVPAQNGSISPS
jgi:heme oxygenase (biliverdin-producing, ferredoxin)